jgi:hypothetical protein
MGSLALETTTGPGAIAREPVTARPPGRLGSPGDLWLISETADFWVACAGGASLLVAMALALLWLGDRELSAADLLLSELHLGATYDAVWRGRLWRRMPFDVVAVPLAILAATYALAWSDRPLLLTTAVLYFGAWHRGRQNLGIARHYQRRVGGPRSRWHRRLLSGAIYLPMAASVAYFTSTASTLEGEPFHGLALPAAVLGALGLLALGSVLAYLVCASGARNPVGDGRSIVHPAERWLVLTNSVAFGSAYVVGAWSAAYILVLALHHEVQYLYFTYAMVRRESGDDRWAGLGSELRRLGAFAVWPTVGLASWAACTLSGLDSLAPFLAGGLLCHYWLDGRIWTARARRLAAA